MAVTGKGDFPLVSTWLGRGRGRGRGLFTALYQNLPSQNTDPFTDLFFEAAAGGASYEIPLLLSCKGDLNSPFSDSSI